MDVRWWSVNNVCYQWFATASISPIPLKPPLPQELLILPHESTPLTSSTLSISTPQPFHPLPKPPVMQITGKVNVITCKPLNIT